MTKDGISPIRWNLTGPPPPGEAKPADAAFEAVFQNAIENGAKGGETSRAQQAALARLWAQQMLAQTQSLLLSSFGAANADKPQSAAASMFGLLALTARLKETAQPPARTRYDRYRPGSDIDEIVSDAAATYGLPEKLIHAVIKAESAYNPAARSPVGAQGLMQLMPQTARELGVSDPWDARQNVFGGSKYLRWMLDRYDGDLKSALAAYNWGPHNVDRKGTTSLPDETRNYIARIAHLLKQEQW